MSRYRGPSGQFQPEKIVRDAAIAAVAILLVWTFWPFRQVPTGSRGVRTQFGAIKGIESEGLVFVPPWQNVNLFSVRAEAAHIDKATGSTSDTQPVDTDLTVRYSILPDRVSEVYEKYSHNGDLSSYVQTATQEVFKAVTARYNAPDLIGKRAQVSNDILEQLRQKLEKYGAQVINIDMRTFAFSESYMKAINDKVTQEQLRLHRREQGAHRRSRAEAEGRRGRSRGERAEGAGRRRSLRDDQGRQRAGRGAARAERGRSRAARKCSSCAASRSNAPRPSAGTGSCRRTSTRARRFRSSIRRRADEAQKRKSPLAACTALKQACGRPAERLRTRRRVAR